MKIRWQIDDGYTGGSRPQSFEISDDELLECESVEEAERLIEDETQTEFEQNTSWYWTNGVKNSESCLTGRRPTKCQT